MTTIERYDVANDVFLDLTTHVVVINHTESERQEIGGDGVVAKKVLSG